MKKHIIASLITLSVFSTLSHATTLTSKINMDNGYIAYISTSDTTAGTMFGSQNDWYHTYTNTTTLTAGIDYYLHIFGYDQGGIAGFLGQFNLSGSDHVFSNNSTTLVTNTVDWKVNNTGWSTPYFSAITSGNNGVGPWGYQSNLSNTAQWIWGGNSDSQDAAYFSTKISATRPVPTPPVILFMATGLLALLGKKRKNAITVA